MFAPPPDWRGHGLQDPAASAPTMSVAPAQGPELAGSAPVRPSQCAGAVVLPPQSVGGGDVGVGVRAVQDGGGGAAVGEANVHHGSRKEFTKPFDFIS